MYRILSCLILTICSAVALAEPIPEVQNFLKEQLNILTTVMNEEESSTNPAMSLDEPQWTEDFSLSSISLSIQASVGYKLPYAANIQIYPQIGLIWQK